MNAKRLAIFIFFLVSSIPCFAGGLKGNIISDEMIVGFWFYVVFIHIFSLLGFYSRTGWLRFLCGLFYLPIFLIPLVLTLFNAGFVLLFVPTIAFFVFIIARTRK